ncbi:hypothetical protein LC605_08490 [Nostoc sp. CHAB 5836]|nr:hypothetical protein [Nostoc sp. CHAB 5836]
MTNDSLSQLALFASLYLQTLVNLCGLIQNQGFLTWVGRFCLCSRDF